jgi:hypothetical protein
MDKRDRGGFPVNYLKALRGARALERPELRNLAAAHIHDLVAAIIGTSRGGAAITETRGVRAARLASIKADIKRHVGRPDLTLLGDLSYFHHVFRRRYGATPSDVRAGSI